MGETISLQEIFSVLKKRMSLIIVSLFIGLGVAGFATYFLLTPLYSSRAQLIVRLPQSEVANVNDINANLQMINTYKDLIKSDVVMKVVQQKLQSEHDQNLSVGEISSSVSVNQSQNSQMFSIEAKSTDQFLAQNIANLTALTFKDKAKATLSVDQITIISDAVASMAPVSPNNKLNLLLGIVAGMLLGIFMAFILELFDKTIKDDRVVEEELGFTILGIVPNMSAKELSSKIVPQTATPINSVGYLSADQKENETNEMKTSSRVESRRNRPKI